MVTTLCMSGSVLIKAGEKVNGKVSGGVLLGGDGVTYAVDEWINQAESVVNATCRYNFTDNYATLNVDTRKILEEVVSNLAAIYAIQYDINAYTSRVEAEDMINILRDAALRGLSLLRDKKAQDFINAS